jgi:four helix bundle suffix protein
MKPHKPDNDVNDKSDSRNSPPAHLGRIRPLSPFQNENRAADGFIPLMIGLIKLTSYLLDQQLRRLEQDFLKQGGLRERMTRARLSQRAKQNYKPPRP